MTHFFTVDGNKIVVADPNKKGVAVAAGFLSSKGHIGFCQEHTRPFNPLHDRSADYEI